MHTKVPNSVIFLTSLTNIVPKILNIKVSLLYQVRKLKTMPFIYQKWKKWESEVSIISILYEGDRTFTDLADLTSLSKPVLSQRLKELKKQGKIEIVPEIETKKFLYHLIRENLDTIDEIFIKIHMFSKITISFLTNFAKDPSISDEEYAKKLAEGILLLFFLRQWLYGLSPIDIRKEWAKNTMGLEFVKSIPQLFPETRDILKYTTKTIFSMKPTMFKTKDQKEAANQLLEHLNSIIETITQKQST